MANSRIRKQVYELTNADLDADPVWTFALGEEGVEGQDEATVRPHKTTGLLDPDDGMFVVRAKFSFANGKLARGYLTPGGDHALGTSQPVIVTPSGQVMFWWGTIVPTASAIADSYAKLELASPTKAFPVNFESDVPLVGGRVSGTIPGFIVLEDWQTGRTRILD